MFIRNNTNLYKEPLLPTDAVLFTDTAASDPLHFFSNLNGYTPTPLQALPALAKSLNIQSLEIKDEGFRMGLGSFKALGGAYAVVNLVVEEVSRILQRPVNFTSDLTSPEVRTIASNIAVACATDGNHGRSVAFGAQLVGAKAVVYVHEGVSPHRKKAIAKFGAKIVEEGITYDASVIAVKEASIKENWILVADTAWPGYETVPTLVMQGYLVILEEILNQQPSPPTHVFIQAGVGGIATAVAARLAHQFVDKKPIVIVVEPERAACFYASAQTGKCISVEPGEPTIMSMLECYEPSLIAWRVLSRLAGGFITIEENEAVDVMKLLANPLASDPVIIAGESGGVGLAGLIKARANAEISEIIGLDTDSRVLLINTESATDPEKFEAYTGIKLQ